MFLYREEFGGLAIDVLEGLPPHCKQTRQVLFGWELREKTPFPIVVLTMHGPIVEMIETHHAFRRQGHALSMLAFASRRLRRPLVALGMTGEGRALVAKATQMGLIGPQRDEDDHYFDD